MALSNAERLGLHADLHVEKSDTQLVVEDRGYRAMFAFPGAGLSGLSEWLPHLSRLAEPEYGGVPEGVLLAYLDFGELKPPTREERGIGISIHTKRDDFLRKIYGGATPEITNKGIEGFGFAQSTKLAFDVAKQAGLKHVILVPDVTRFHNIYTSFAISDLPSLVGVFPNMLAQKPPGLTADFVVTQSVTFISSISALLIDLAKKRPVNDINIRSVYDNQIATELKAILDAHRPKDQK